MAIKAGAFLTNANGTLIDRIQTGGPGSLNIPSEKIYELGNWRAVSTVYDIPDLSFTLNSTDVSTEFESKLLNATPHAVIGDSTVGSLHEFDFLQAMPVDITSPFKISRGEYTIVKSIAVPYLNLESASYKFGVGTSSTQEFGLRGDSIYYIPGNVFYEEFTYNGSAAQSKTFGFPAPPNGTVTGATTAIEYVDGVDTLFAYCCTLINTSNNTYKRLFHGADYTDSTTGFEILNANAGYDRVRVVYGGNGTVTYPQAVHQDATVKPAAVRGKDIDVYVGSTDATPVFTKFHGVQTAEVDWKVTLDNDQELGNHNYVAQDYDVPDVTGSLAVKPFDVEELWSQLSIITGVDAAQTIGPNVTVPVPLVIKVNDPAGEAGVLKTFYVPDARFTVPGLSGQANTKLNTTFDYTSDGGVLYVYDGDEFDTP